MARDLALVAIADSNYASRAAAMIESSGAARFSTVLAMDEGVSQLQDKLDGLDAVDWHAFLNANPFITKKISVRTLSEQIFSVGPSFLLSKSDSVDPGGWLVYADADLFFFNPIQPYLDSLPECNVVLAPHRHYPWNSKRLAKYGEYNVGLVAFRNNCEGLKALRYWAESCLEWCFDRPEEGKYADQKYLEHFSSIAEGVFIDTSLGSNLAPWNSFLVKISAGQSGEVYVGSDRLNYLHAQGLKNKNGRWILGNLNYLSLAGKQMKKLVYGPYLGKLEEWTRNLDFASFGTSRPPSSRIGSVYQRFLYGLSLVSGQTVKVGKLGSEGSE